MIPERQFSNLGIIGGGAFGSALATVATSATGKQPPLLVRTKQQDNHTCQAADLRTSDALVYAVKAQALPELIPHLCDAGLGDKPLLIAAKGLLSNNTPLLMNAARQLGWKADIGVLSGPGFAQDIVDGRPFAVTIASENLHVATAFCQALATPLFRPYASTDPVGVSLAGALKNVMAIACGITIGLGLGESARAALMARGLAEMTRIGVAMGAEAKTFRGLSGVGDLALTCTSEQSRNFRCGLALGQGQSLTKAEEQIGTVEGIATTAAVVVLAERMGIDLPISQELFCALFQGKPVADCIRHLLARDIGLET